MTSPPTERPRGAAVGSEVGALYAAHRLTLVRLALLLGADRAAAETAAQRAFLRLLRRSGHGTDGAETLERLRADVIAGVRRPGRRDPEQSRSPSTEPVLTHRQREAAVLTLWDGLSTRQAARTLRTSDDAVSAAVREAVEAFRRDGEPEEDAADRLAGWFHGRAGTVDQDDLSSTFGDVVAQDERIRARRRRFLLVALGAVATVALVVAGTQAFANRPAPVPEVAEPTPTPTPTTTTTPLSSPALAPGEQPRTAVPWDQVGRGWAVVTTTTPANAVSTTLLLVSPTGTRYALGTSADGMALQDVSPDGRKVLLAIGTDVTEWDLAAGTARRIGNGYGWKTVRYAGTADSGLLVLWVDNQSGIHLERRAPDGRATAEYPVSVVPAAGSIGTPAVVVDRSGTTVAVGSRDGSVQVLDLNLDAFATLPNPAGTANCLPQSRWDTTILVTCRDGRPNLFRATTDGSAFTVATTVQGNDAWPFEAGVLVQRGETCSGDLVLDRGGALTPVALPGAAAGLVPQTLLGSTLYLGATQCPTDGDRLVTYDLVTHTVTELVGPDVDGRSVRSGRVLDPPG